MKNKRGWIKIVEAVLAVLLLSVFLVFVYIRHSDGVDIGEYVYRLERSILVDIEKNNTLRGDVLSERKDRLNDFADSRISEAFDFSFEICSFSEICGLKSREYPIDKNIYADSVLITSTLEEYEPKQLKLFIWTKD
jgi:hypothetical protein